MSDIKDDIIKNEIRNELDKSKEIVLSFEENKDSKHLAKRLNEIKQQLDGLSEKQAQYYLTLIAKSNYFDNTIKAEYTDAIPIIESYETRSFKCKNDFDRCYKITDGWKRSLCIAIFLFCLIRG